VVAKIHVGATLVPHFRDFLPGWVARQEWYRGSGTPSLRPIGFFRFEDPGGQVGIETHLVSDGTDIYQIPMTYRGAPIPLADAEPGLIATAEHSVLGTRWIYDGTIDPVWRQELLRLVQTGGVSDPSAKRGVASAEARGHPLGTITPETATIDLRRLLAQATATTDAARETAAAGAAEDTTPAGATEEAVTADVAGEVVGTWFPDGPESPSATGLLALVRSPQLRTRPRPANPTGPLPSIQTRRANRRDPEELGSAANHNSP
jgi:hypothetical protein